MSLLVNDTLDTIRCFVFAWLILPVVICLSQRLNHACLSITQFIWEDCEYLLKSAIVYLIVTEGLLWYNWITAVILELIHAKKRRVARRVAVFIRFTKPIQSLGHSKRQQWRFGRRNKTHWWFTITFRIVCGATRDDVSFKFLIYHLVVSIENWLGSDGYGELEFGSGESAWETANTSKDGSRCANCPILIQGGSDNK